MRSAIAGGSRPEPSAARPAGIAWLVLAMVLAAVVRRWGWDCWSLWMDETMQVHYARQSFVELLRTAVRDGNNPPLDYILTWLVRQVSESDAALRLPSLLWGMGATAALFVRAGGFRHRAAAVSAALFFAVLPVAVHYGQEVRPYSLALFLVAAADAARRRFVETRGRGPFVLYLLLSTAAAYTLHLALLALGAIWLLEALDSIPLRATDTTRFRAALAVPAAVLVLFLPWVLLIRGYGPRTHEIPAPRPTLRTIAQLGIGLATDRQPADRALVAAVVGTVALVGIGSLPRGQRRWIALPIAVNSAGVLVILTVANHWWAIRYIVLTTLPLSLAVGEGTARVASLLTRRRAFEAAAALTLALGALQLPALADNASRSRPDWRPVAAYLSFEDGRGLGGPIVAADGWSFFVLRFQTLRLRPPLETGPIVQNGADLESLMQRERSGWVIRTPHHPVAPDLDGVLRRVRPWAVFREAEEAKLYRFQEGRLLEP